MKQCPICFEELIVQDCTPCDDCGCDHEEIVHFNQSKHIYKIYEIYNGLRLTLCNFCDVDFSSYKPEYFGFKNGHKLGFQNFNFVKEIEKPEITKDKVCTKCSHKLTFLDFLIDIREINKAN